MDKEDWLKVLNERMSEALYKRLLWIRSDEESLIAAGVKLWEERKKFRREALMEDQSSLAG